MVPPQPPADKTGQGEELLSSYLLDRDIDDDTGLPYASHSASGGVKGEGTYDAGIVTAYVFDTMGRLTWSRPASGHGAWQRYQYLKYGTCSGPAKAETCSKPNGTATDCVNEASACSPLSDSLTRSAYHYDQLGRLVGEYTKYTASLWNQRLTEYDGMNRKTAVSEWQANGTTGAAIRKTTYGFCGDHDWDAGTATVCDAFGRVLTITPADGTAHDIKLRYTGNRLVERKTRVATSSSSEADSVTTEESDRQGRLWKVTEPSGTAGANVTTTYTQDVGNRLKGVSTTSGATQNRYFTYDNRGFLLSEQLPEKGSSGNGTVSYSNIDARGHAGSVQDGAGGPNLGFCYDRAERVTLVASPPTSCASPVSTSKLKEFAYATSNNGSDKRIGKLVTAVRHNRVAGSDYEVTEGYTYAGVGGRASARTTSVDGRSIAQTFTWNELGGLSWQQYPNDSVLADAVEPPRKVINTYTQGLLTKVCEGSSPPTCATNYASTIGYHANLMVNQVAHANGVTVTYAKDDNDMRRPKSIATSSATPNWSTGTYQYDGAGNVWKIGASEVFIYDKVSRLTSGTVLAAGTPRTQTAAFDSFGNMTTTTTHFGTRPFTVDAATNRVTNLSFSYDAAGNQTGWSDGAQTFTYTFNPLNEALTYVTLGVNHTYLYSVDGERIEDWDNTANTRTISVRDLAGKVLRLHTRNSSGQWSWAKDYVYRDGLQVASIEPPVATPVVKHFHLDHLGTIRRITNASRAVVAGHDYYPFGLEATSITQDAERMKFTGHERDLHSSTTQNDDLDYMHARYYNPNVARFLGPDPANDTSARMPQSWNKYTYVRNNPIRLVDPRGTIVAMVGEAKADLMGLVSEALGLQVFEDKMGNLTRQEGPPAANAVAAVEAFDRAASSSTPKFTIEAKTNTNYLVVDRFDGPGQGNPIVNPAHIAALPAAGGRPEGRPQAATRGELVAHIFGEYAYAASQGGDNGGFNGANFPAAHGVGNYYQNAYRLGLGQSGLDSARSRLTPFGNGGAALTLSYTSGNATVIGIGADGAVDSISHN